MKTQNAQNPLPAGVQQEAGSSHDYVREAAVRYIGPRRKGPKLAGPEDAASFMVSFRQT